MKWQFPQPIRDNIARVWTHHQTELMKISRLIFCKDLGIDQQHVSDYPPSSTTTNVKTNSPLSMAISAATVLGSAGLGAAAMRVIAPEVAVPAAVAPAVIDSAKAKVELFYDDPDHGLVPITGAASQQGTTLTPKR